MEMLCEYYKNCEGRLVGSGCAGMEYSTTLLRSSRIYILTLTLVGNQESFEIDAGRYQKEWSLSNFGIAPRR